MVYSMLSVSCFITMVVVSWCLWLGSGSRIVVVVGWRWLEWWWVRRERVVYSGGGARVLVREIEMERESYERETEWEF
ncbi:hypothetical protein Hanom_Chr16g01515791 [Helianthus anomalus]